MCFTGSGKATMRVFVYEYFTALGIGREPHSREHGIYCEGLAMRNAVAEDFARIPGVEVLPTPEHVPGKAQDTFSQLADDADVCLAIAPECDGILLKLRQQATSLRCRFLGSSVEAIALTSNKLALAEHWRSCGIRTPATSDRQPTACEAFPLIWKPRDGAGSTDTFLLTSALDVTCARSLLAQEPESRPMILQEFVPGQAASVAFLCGPAGHIPLLPALQALSTDGRFKYLGGELPIPTSLATRAIQLGQQAVGCVLGLLGYVGVDLVLGAAEDGSQDAAIEINPRLTTSYVGLRRLANFNLASAMLQSARAELHDKLTWQQGRVRFSPDGAVTRL
jgi:predicted ATP-grasp superfamily ATP-dependent carboligase